ncbi:MAG TPA: 1-acyl-sn-glycerol-3-phosphate acyltransferase [Thermoanaerobaculia bacterium]
MNDPQALPVPLADRWIRRAIIATAGLGFTLPYFELLNRLDVTGADLLGRLPRRGVVFLSNHQTYYTEAMAFYHLVYIRHRFPMEVPFLRFSAAEETMKKNLLTEFMIKAGGVTFRRSFREGGVEVSRLVDFEGVSRVEDAIRDGWLLHFPTGTTQKGAPIRPGVAQILHRTKAVAVPMRIDRFRGLLLHKQIPGYLFRSVSLHLHEPLDLGTFYAQPYSKEGGRALVARLTEILGDPA